MTVDVQHRNIENEVKVEDCGIKEMDCAPLTHDAYTGCPKKIDPTLQCHIFKNIEFDVFKFSTVI